MEKVELEEYFRLYKKFKKVDDRFILNVIRSLNLQQQTYMLSDFLNAK